MVRNPRAAGAPGAPSSIGANFVYEGTASIVWNWPTAGEPPFTYRLQVATNSSFTNVVVDVDGLTERTYDAHDLDAITRYYMRVNAKNASGTGPWSVTRVFDTSYWAPDAPTNVTVGYATGSPDAIVGWDEPDPNGTGIVMYQVTVYDRPSMATPIKTILAPAPPATVAGLTPMNPYWFRVKAQNDSGWGPNSVGVQSNVPPIPPAAPRNIRLAGATATSLTVAFDPPANLGGGAIRFYEVQVVEAGGGSSYSADGGKSPITVGGLDAGEAYQVRVRAYGTVGPGPQSDWVEMDTLDTAWAKNAGTWVKAPIWGKRGGRWYPLPTWRKEAGSWQKM